jgi:hypothetical protein
VTITGSDKQSGTSLAFQVTNTENQKQSSKTQYNTKSVANSKYKCALGHCIHVRFGIKQQLAYCLVTITGSVMQSGILVTRTEHQKQT